MGGMFPVLIHIHLLQGLVHPAADLGAGNAQILRAKCHILLHHIGNDLIVRVLKHHSHVPADHHEPRFIGSVDPADPHLSPGGQ